MHHKFRDYLLRNFNFSSSEIRGIFTLIVFMIVSFTIPSLFHRYLLFNTDDITDAEQELLAEWLTESKSKLKADVTDYRTANSLVVAYFDPNEITQEEWVARGFSKKTASTIHNYLDKGGRFQKKQDVLKIYGIDQGLVKSYFEYMKIPSLKKVDVKPINQIDTKVSETISKPKKAKKPFVKPNLNSADSIEFQTVRGIGAYYARKLVTYRSKLGGYIDEDQLLEIYGIDTTVQHLIIENTVFEPKVFRPIDLNNAGFDELFKHPYLDYRTTVAILKYKKQHGSFQEVEDLKKILILKDSIYQKIKPYLIITGQEN